MDWTSKELNDAEEGINSLVEATGLSDKEIIEILASGFAFEYKGRIPDKFRELLDELRATFDAY